MASFAEIHKNTIINTYISENSSFQEDCDHTDADKILKIEYSRYIRNKILYDCLTDCMEDLDPETGEKLERIVNNTKLKQYMKLQNHNLLGLNLKNPGLSYKEGVEVKSFLQKKIWEKKAKTHEEFKSITSKDLSQVVRGPLHDYGLSQDQSNIAYKEKLAKIQELFMKNVSTRNNILEEMLNLRLNKIPELCSRTNHYCKASIESNYLKAKIAEYKMKLDIFMEIPKCIDAYHQLLKDIKKQQEESELSIERMKELKRRFEDIGGREYDEILKSYLMYKSSLDKLNKMYELVK